jgi:type I restriction enzyme S subunit
MPERRKPTTFADLVERGILEIGDGYRAKLDELGGNGPIFLRAGLLSERGIDWTSAERFRAELISTVRSKFGRSGDTIVTTKGNSVGRTGYIPSGAPQFVYSPHLSYWRSLDSSRLSPGFLRYWSQSSEFTMQLQAMANSTDMAPYLSLSDQRRLRISLPEVAIQNATAKILGALDDKIVVNDRIAAAADDLARALLNEILADEAGLTQVPLADVAVVNGRKVAPAPGGYLRYVDISRVSAGLINWPERMAWNEAPGRARRGVSPGDTIWSTVRPGRRSFAFILDDDQELVASTGFAVLTPRNVGPAFLYEITKRDEFVQYLESVAEGSAYPAVQADRFERAMIPLPSPSGRERFEAAAMELRRREHAARRESRILAELRDALLPRLMSGEIRVRHAEKFVEDAT